MHDLSVASALCALDVYFDAWKQVDAFLNTFCCMQSRQPAGDSGVHFYVFFFFLVRSCLNFGFLHVGKFTFSKTVLQDTNCCMVNNDNTKIVLRNAQLRKGLRNSWMNTAATGCKNGVYKIINICV